MLHFKHREEFISSALLRGRGQGTKSGYEQSLGQDLCDMVPWVSGDEESPSPQRPTWRNEPQSTMRTPLASPTLLPTQTPAWAGVPFPSLTPLIFFPGGPEALCLVVHHGTTTNRWFGARQGGFKSQPCCVTWGGVLTSLSLKMVHLIRELL